MGNSPWGAVNLLRRHGGLVSANAEARAWLAELPTSRTSPATRPRGADVAAGHGLRRSGRCPGRRGRDGPQLGPDPPGDTVRDHVKAIVAKVGVTSRGELVARLFADYYEPVHLQDAGRAWEG